VNADADAHDALNAGAGLLGDLGQNLFEDFTAFGRGRGGARRRLRMGTYPCAQKQELALPPPNSAALPYAFSRRFSASLVSRMLRTALKLPGFHDAQAARSVLAAPRAGQRPLQRTTKRRNDGRGSSVAQRCQRSPEAQRQQERHSRGELEFASAGLRLANVGVCACALVEGASNFGTGSLPQGRRNG